MNYCQRINTTCSEVQQGLSRPELSNSMRALSKVMDKGTVKHFKVLTKSIKCVWRQKTPDSVLSQRLLPTDFCVDQNTRKRVTGFVIFINGVGNLRESKKSTEHKLSSTEAAYVAVTEAVRSYFCVIKPNE